MWFSHPLPVDETDSALGRVVLWESGRQICSMVERFLPINSVDGVR